MPFQVVNVCQTLRACGACRVAACPGMGIWDSGSGRLSGLSAHITIAGLACRRLDVCLVVACPLALGCGAYGVSRVVQSMRWLAQRAPSAYVAWLFSGDFGGIPAKFVAAQTSEVQSSWTYTLLGDDCQSAGWRLQNSLSVCAAGPVCREVYEGFFAKPHFLLFWGVFHRLFR
jgi:hypothetical protein